ncbi:hypothetical protein MSG28_013744 [Choristoneura fumiferana]|uniref:Uncharacterized protein n=1 Tax=Choristoneura fumiferana TaxID=7141 RepID=A0ACC0K990_CHOFU|nr:hypothetical protein MSG28_013744 [Choristoneura fumiferana]
MSKSTICNAISEVCAAINEALQNYAKTPSTEEEWLSIAQEFNEKWNFPNCIGAVDGKHCVIQAPINSGSDFFNYKSTFSVVLMAIVDANYNFIFADIGCQGRISDGGVFRNTSFYQKLQNNELNLPNDQSLPGRPQNMPFFPSSEEEWLAIAEEFEHHNLLGLCRPDFQVRGRLTIYKPEWGYSHGIFSLSVQEFPCQQVQQLSHAALKVLRSLGVAASFHLHLDVRQRLQGVEAPVQESEDLESETIASEEPEITESTNSENENTRPHHNLLGLCRPDFQVRGRLTIYKPEWGYSHGIFSLSVQEFPCQQVQQLSHAALKVLRSLGVAASFHLHLDVRQRLQGGTQCQGHR